MGKVYSPMRTAARCVSTLLLLNVSLLLSSVFAQTKPQQILVAAASDLQPLQSQLVTAFGQFSGDTVTLTFGASSLLAQQIEHGAPFDVYLSANEAFVSHLGGSGHLLTDTIKVYAYGRIALWSKTGQIRTIQDLARPEVKRVAIANPAHAPYGVAAKEALKSQGLWEKLEPKIVYGENVAQAFQYAQSGNADAAIVAHSLASDKNAILLPSTWHQKISQSGGVVASSRNPGLARKFMMFLGSREGRLIFQSFGFDLPAS